MRLKRHALVLAGGRGTRLQRITRALGQPSEKQFCRLGDDRTLLQATTDRLEGLVGSTTVVVRSDQLPLASAQLAERRRVQIVGQPSDRGTGIGVLVGLLSAYRSISTGVVLLAPADHGFSDEEVLRDVLAHAADVAETSGRIVLVGAEADAPRCDYGWIVPTGAGEPRSVARFVEKPPLEEAEGLHAAGGLFNTMMLAAPVEALMRLFSRVSPRPVSELVPAAAMGGPQRDGYLRSCFGSLPYLDFSRELIATAPDLMLLTLPAVAGWTDLGDERRVMTWLKARGAQTELARVRAICASHLRKAQPAQAPLLRTQAASNETVV